MKFFILGPYGNLGSRLCPYLECRGHEVFKLGRSENEIKSIFSKIIPDSIVNLAANTNVDDCERNLKSAYLSNVEPLKIISKYINTDKTHLIQISTDQVYSGIGPHDEDKPLPCNVYGLTKFAGELLSEKMNATIIRTNYVGKSLNKRKASLANWLINSLQQQTKLTLFNDIKFNPVHGDFLCKIITISAERRTPGTFNLGSSQSLSKADFCIQIAKDLNLDLTNARVGPSTANPLRAPRPKDMTLSINKIEEQFSIKTPQIHETIKDLVSEYKR